jgi:dolichyl-phosphate beta-glucosyltransferase
MPAYNEEDRMRAGIDEALAHLKAAVAAAAAATGGENSTAPSPAAFTWELIIVDDGSKDATAAVAMDIVRSEGSERVRLLRLHANSGKGAAVRKGVLRARGRYVLMADVDGATRFADLDRLLEELRRVESPGGDGVAFGSRAHMEEGEEGGVGEKEGDAAAATPRVQRSPVRRFLMWGFHTLIGLLLGGTSVRDSQCGFKLFTRSSASRLFSALHIERWAFDVELVYLIARLRLPLVEVPVQWHEVGGSKVGNLASAALQMARDTIVVRLAYALGWWTEDGGGSSGGGAATSLTSPYASEGDALSRRVAASGSADGVAGPEADGRPFRLRGTARARARGRAERVRGL